MRTAAEIFTRAAMTRPLFEPLTEQHERPDEWSGPLGFVIGGFSRPAMQAERDSSLALQYFEAAEALVEAIVDKRIADYQVANAALFLYRHSVELLLKSGLPPTARAKKNVHNLSNLARSYAHHKQKCGMIVPAWVIHRCEELATIDPGSEAFRYGDYGTPQRKGHPPIEDEVHVDLFHLKAAMAALNAALVEQNWLIRMAKGERP